MCGWRRIAQAVRQPERAIAAAVRSHCLDQHAAGLQVGAGEHVAVAAHGAGDDLVAPEQGHAFLAAVAGQAFLQHGAQFGAMGDAAGIGGEARIARQLLASHHAAEPLPMLLRIRGEHDVAVARGHDVGGGRVVRLAVADARGLGPAAQVFAPGRRLQVQGGLQQRGLQSLALPGALAPIQRGQDSLRADVRGRGIDDGHAHLLRKPIGLAGHGHQPAFGLRRDVVARAIARRPPLGKPEIDR
jgi:hypothetical protein